MCGIAGFIGEDQEKVQMLSAALRHRGPDHQASIVTHGASLGYARLAILDPRPEGNQPMWSASHHSVIVYNGEIYNFKLLREKYHLSCKTNSDTEVILELYEKLGFSFVSELAGMFAFAIYDTRKRSFLLARDTSGMKPLYVSYPNGKLHFASELSVLLKALPVKPALNMRSLSLYLALQYVPGPETLCEGIESLPPGTVLYSTLDGKEERKILLPSVTLEHFSSPKDLKNALPMLLDNAVKSHLVSDKPVGLFLSGGMDSSIMLHHMVQHAAKPVRTFTVRFEASEEEGSERLNRDADLAKMTAAHYETEHREILFSAAECRQVYKDSARSLDQPNADSVAMAQFVLSREAKKVVDVVLTGAGGDELFGGYPRYRIAHILQSLGSLKFLLRCFPGVPIDLASYSPGPALAARLLGRPEEELLRMVKGGWFQGGSTLKFFEEHFSEVQKTHGQDARATDQLREFMEVDRATWLVDESLRLADAVTMAHGLEGRMPFLDPRTIVSVNQTPGSWHIGMRNTKKLLKETYYPILPKHLRTLPKASFFPPLAKWIRRECAPIVLESLENPRIQDLFDTVALRRMFEEHRTLQTYALHPLSSIAQLSAWFETVYDAR